MSNLSFRDRGLGSGASALSCLSHAFKTLTLARRAKIGCRRLNGIGLSNPQNVINPLPKCGVVNFM